MNFRLLRSHSTVSSESLCEKEIGWLQENKSLPAASFGSFIQYFLICRRSICTMVEVLASPTCVKILLAFKWSYAGLDWYSVLNSYNCEIKYKGTAAWVKEKVSAPLPCTKKNQCCLRCKVFCSKLDSHFCCSTSHSTTSKIKTSPLLSIVLPTFSSKKKKERTYIVICSIWETQGLENQLFIRACYMLLLTQFIVECVVFGEDRLGIANVSSSNKPIHIGVPAVHKATKMIFFKVTFCNCKHQLSAHIFFTEARIHAIAKHWLFYIQQRREHLHLQKRTHHLTVYSKQKQTVAILHHCCKIHISILFSPISPFTVWQYPAAAIHNKIK